MEDFFTVFENMKRQGPGSVESTLRSFQKIPQDEPLENILDVGSGKGASAFVLAEHSSAKVYAIDLHQPFVDHIFAEAEKKGLDDQIQPMNMSMADLAFENQKFDLIWSEGSAYNMGFENALEYWHSFIRKNGWIFISEAVWTTDNPDKALKEYWLEEYPDIKDVKTRETQAVRMGYEIVDSFLLPRQDWVAFYEDVENSLNQLACQKEDSPVLEEFRKEVEINRKYGDQYSYLCLMLQRRD